MLLAMRVRTVWGMAVVVVAAAACGGGSGNAGNTATVTAPTATVTMAEFAPSLGEAVASTIDAALRAGTSASLPQEGVAATLRRLTEWFAPVTLHAQASSFAANCSRGGNVNIRYAGLRPVVMAGTDAVFSRCGTSFRGRDLFFSGTIRLGGYWTAGDPGPVSTTGTVDVEEIGAALLNGSVTGQRYNGTVAGVTVGTPDTAPPPSPNTCPGGPAQASIQVPSGGGTYAVNVQVGATCPWSVTSGPSWVNVTVGTGRGNGAVNFTVSANAGAVRSGTLVVNNQNVTINQSAAVTAPPPPTTSGQDTIIGRWEGTVTVSQPCGTLPGNYSWRATITRSGSAYSMALFTSFSFETRNIPIPVLGSDRTFEFSWNDAEIGLTLRLRGTFAADWQSLSGSANGSIICNPSRPAEPLNGQWQGRRIGS